MADTNKTMAELTGELEQTKALLFLAVRNTTVLPKGLLLGKTEEEISAMVFAVIEEMKKSINFETVKKLMALGEK